MVEHDDTPHSPDSNNPERTVKNAQVPPLPPQMFEASSVEKPVIRTDSGGILPDRENPPQPEFARRKSKIPPPPTAQVSVARTRIRKRKGRKRNSGADWAWVVVAGTIFGIAMILGLAAVFVLQSPKSEPEVSPVATDDLSALPTPLYFRTELE